MKKGQISFFLVLAGMIVLAMMMYSLISYPKVRILPVVSSPITTIEHCLEKILTDGIILLGAQGGYITPPEHYIADGGKKIAVHSMNRVIMFPMREDIEHNLAQYIEKKSDVCIQKYTGVRISEGSAGVTLEQQTVRVVLHHPILLGQRTVEEFQASVSAPLGAMHETMSELLASLQPGRIPLTILAHLPFQAKVFIQEKIVLLILSSSTFTFASAIIMPDNLPPRFLVPGEIHLAHGEGFLLRADDPEHDALSFGTDSPAFPVTPEGMLTTTASPGRYLVTLVVTDAHELSDSQLVEVDVS